MVGFMEHAFIFHYKSLMAEWLEQAISVTGNILS